MATSEERDLLRRKTGTVGDDEWPDELLDQYIENAGDDIDAAAASVWRDKAAAYAELTDISEAGSSRKNSVLYKNAMEQAEYFDGIDEQDDIPAPGTYSTTRRIIRA